MNWLQGGPFFELSFIIEENDTVQKTINSLLNSSTVSILVHNPPEYYDEFYNGYPFDEDEPDGKIIHHICLNLTVGLKRTRRSLLFIDRINLNLLCLSLCFFGSEFDAPEWQQPGINAEEHYEFYSLLRDIYNEFNFIIGGSAIEEDAKAFFNTTECWPDQSYSLERITVEAVNDNMKRFYQIIINDKLKLIHELDSNDYQLNKLSNGIEIII